MISRSKSAPLFIESSPILANHDFDKVASIVMSNIHRIQELDIGGRDDQKLFEFLRLNEGASASILQVLTLRSPMDSTLPKDILEREMGSLRELHIFDGTLASPIPPFPRLKRLVIEPPYLLVDVLLESLRNAPNLEEVRVRRVHVPTDIVTLSAVHLPRLTHLDIHGLTIATSKILPLLKRPPTVNFTYHCQELLPPGCDMSNIRNALVQFVSHPGRVIRNVSVNTHNPFSIVLDTVLHSDSQSFEVTLGRHPINRDDELDQLLSVIPFAKIPSLTLINGSKATASRLFRLCDEVTVLTLTTCEPAAFRALQKKVKDSKHPLPKLRRLVVDQCQFNVTYRRRYVTMCEALLAFLKQRKEFNMVVELTIQDCGIVWWVVDMFGRYAKVDWDNFEPEYERDDEENWGEEEEEDDDDDDSD